jgi:hypothetical protein
VTRNRYKIFFEFTKTSNTVHAMKSITMLQRREIRHKEKKGKAPLEEMKIGRGLEV